MGARRVLRTVRLPASLARTVCPTQHVDPQRAATQPDTPPRVIALLGAHGGIECSLSELVERARPERGLTRLRRRLGAVLGAFNGHEPKRDGLPRIAVEVVNPINQHVAGAGHLADIAEEASLHVLKEVKLAPAGRVITHGAIAADKLHVANLALAEVAEGAVFLPAVVVAIGGAALAGDEQNQRVVAGRGDPALLLAAILLVDDAGSGVPCRTESSSRRPSSPNVAIVCLAHEGWDANAHRKLVQPLCLLRARSSREGGARRRP